MHIEGHAPQRDEQCEGGRDENDRQLELGRVVAPLHKVSVHVVTRRVTNGDSRAYSCKILQLIGDRQHG